MKFQNELDAYSTLNALKRINLPKEDIEEAKELIELFEDNNRANVQKIHEKLFRYLDTANATDSLNRFIDIINEKAKVAGVPIACCITEDNKGEAANRWVWFEGTPAAPEASTGDLEKIGDNVIEQEAFLGDSLNSIVILTFNENEKNAVIKKFSPSQEPPTCMGEEKEGFDLGEHGGFRVILLYCAGQGANEAQAYASSAWRGWRPVAILSVGIGYGAQLSEQQIGDVLISKAVQDCNLEKIESDITITPRGPQYPSSRDLFESIKNLNTRMQNNINWPKLHFGKILSRNDLINNAVYRKALFARYDSKAIGGEMEGAGLAFAAHDHYDNFAWILIKGISDFAEEKDMDKDERQRIAARNAAKVIFELLNAEPPTIFHRRRLTRVMPEIVTKIEDFEKIKAYMEQSVKEDSMNKLDDMMDISPDFIADLKDLEKLKVILDQDWDYVSMDKLEDPVNIEKTSGGVKILETLMTWANDKKGLPLCALLGEYGMGKTITCQRFVKQMNEQREQDSTKKAVLYFDLRKVTDPSKVPSRDDVILECARRGWKRNNLPESDKALLSRIYKWLELGSIVVFDGLDEVLVKLDEKNGINFIHTLLSILDVAEQDQGKMRKIDIKVLISTRTQYFRTLRNQRNSLTDEERGNRDKNAWQTMHLLPFNDGQVRLYLSAAIPNADIERIEELIQSVHNLKDLTKRPYTLWLISELIPEIEKRKELGRTVYSVTLYDEITKRWLERDWSKEYIKFDDKLNLATHLAAFLWQEQEASASAEKIEDRLFDWIESEPRLKRRYEGYSKDRLEEDLRNSTFLARFDKSANESVFRFSHTSLLEYFLARYLFDALREDFPIRWKIPCPSAETFDFLGQLLAESGDKRLTETMQKWGVSDNVEVNVNLLRYALRAKKMKYPSPHLRGIRLSGAKLREIDITLDLPEAVFDRADLHEAVFRCCNLQNASFMGADVMHAQFPNCDLQNASFNGANVTRAKMLGCNLEHADMSRAILTRTIFRNTLLNDARMEDLDLQRTQWLWCKGLPEKIKNSKQCFVTDKPQNNEIFPAGSRVLRSFSYSGSISSVSWAPDGSLLATAGRDGNVRLWSKSGECLSVLEGHTNVIKAVSWAPDGSLLATAGMDGSVIIWGSNGERTMKIEIFNRQEYAVWNGDNTLRFASPEAWQWLGWQTVNEGKIDRLPAELFGPLPAPPAIVTN